MNTKCSCIYDQLHSFLILSPLQLKWQHFFLYESLNLFTFFYQLKIIKRLVVIVELLNELEECGPRCENPRRVPGSQSTTLFPACVCMCVLFFQSVIVIPLAQSVIAVMAQDFVYVRRALQGLSVRSVYPAICGTMAANVSRTTNPHAAPGCSPPQLCLSLLSLSGFSSLCVIPELWLEECAAHARNCSAALTNTELTGTMS